MSNIRTGKLIDDDSLKFLWVRYPPLDGGPEVVLAYADWLRKTLRGEKAETFDSSMQHLLDRLDRDIPPFRRPLTVNAQVIHIKRRYFGGLSNVKRDRLSFDC